LSALGVEKKQLEPRAVAASCSLCSAIGVVVMGEESTARAAALAEGWVLSAAFGLEALTCPKCSDAKHQKTKKPGKKRRLPVVEGSG
jgi:hypothetical protein